jgi:hypothetical protein
MVLPLLILVIAPGEGRQHLLLRWMQGNSEEKQATKPATIARKVGNSSIFIYLVGIDAYLNIQG